jgi:hypothetical protein
MPPDCLFCDNPAGSWEHLWAAWIHERKDFGPLKVTIGNSPQEIRDDPEQRIDTVCAKCNNGWMSAIENKNKPVIACMFEDLTIPLDCQQQTLLSNWAVKTAMVLDSMKNTESNPRFYLKFDYVTFRERRIIPNRVCVWIGRYSVSGLGAYGTDVAIAFPDQAKIGIGTATTIVTGHLAVQVFAMRLKPEHSQNKLEIQPKAGDWDNMLVPIWPIARESVTWPPKVTFTTSGERSLAALMDRWRIGQLVANSPRE